MEAEEKSEAYKEVIKAVESAITAPALYFAKYKLLWSDEKIMAICEGIGAIGAIIQTLFK